MAFINKAPYLKIHGSISTLNKVMTRDSGQFSKLGSLVGYPDSSGPPDNSNSKRDPNLENPPLITPVKSTNLQVHQLRSRELGTPSKGASFQGGTQPNILDGRGEGGRKIRMFSVGSENKNIFGGS